jgi:hypothetical protein
MATAWIREALEIWDEEGADVSSRTDEAVDACVDWRAGKVIAVQLDSLARATE